MIKDEATTQLIQTITESIRKTSDFAVEQMPDIAQSYILYGRVSLVIYTLFFMLMAAGCLYVVIKSNDKDVTTLTELFTCVGVVAFPIITLIELNDLLLVFLSPKFYLLKGFGELFK